MRYLIAVAAVALATTVQAASVNKCVGPDGKITFTQQACPGGGQPDEVVSANNPSPNGRPPIATPRRDDPRWHSVLPSTPHTTAPSPRSGFTVAGDSGQRKGCSTGLSERDERTATVRGQAMKGMTKAQIESIYGKPDTVSTANGAVDYRYWSDRNRKYVHVGFDRDGCADWVYESQDD
jgi:hypothetical protein